MAESGAEGMPALSIRAAFLMFRMRLRRDPPAIPVLLAGATIAAVGTALQTTASVVLAFLTFLIGGLVLGLVCRTIRDAMVAAFLMGDLSFLAGLVAAGVWLGITGDAPGTDLLGAVVGGLIFGVIPGLWSAGAAWVAGFFRRHPFAGHVL
ncbi:MAG TPA: hypothetical protein VGR51_08030 [Thermoplasmata archaeon]|nr:hypothetical protein [Thermoplasmata archaeon]